MRDLGIIAYGALAISGERITHIGTTAEVHALVRDAAHRIDARGKAVLPGFVDAHTHVVFAGDRVEEFERRLGGATYQEIMAGGELRFTMAKQPNREWATAASARPYSSSTNLH